MSCRCGRRPVAPWLGDPSRHEQPSGPLQCASFERGMWPTSPGREWNDPSVVGTPNTRLVILRGNSGSGKTSVARALQKRWEVGHMAVVSQDLVRRDVLRASDTVGNPAIGLIDLMARYALDTGCSVVIEGLLHADRYAEMLIQLVREHRGATRAYFWDLPFEETLRRHATKVKALEFGESEMREWWYGTALIPELDEARIGPAATLDATVRRIEDDCRWV